MKNLKVFSLVLFLSTFFFQVQCGLSITDNSDADSLKSANKIAIAAVGDSVDSEISKVAARAPYFLLFNEKGNFVKAIKNLARYRRGGTSSVVVALLKKESVKTIIAGRFGDKMKTQLRANKIEYFESVGVAKNIVETFVKDKRSKK